MKRSLGLGQNYFRYFLKSDSDRERYYVDKTAFLKDLILHGSRATVIARPRRFGRTLTFSTLSCFLTNEFDQDEQRALFDGTEISRDPEFCRTYMGKYPVISCCVFFLVHSDPEMFRYELANLIADMAGQHEYLAKSDKLSAADKKVFAAMRGCRYKKKNDEFLVSSLATLTRLLYQHHGQKVMLFVDDYDMPFSEAARLGIYDGVLKLLLPLYTKLIKEKPFLETAYLMGHLPIGGDGIFEAMGNPRLNTVVTSPNPLAAAVGYSAAETGRLLDDFGIGAFEAECRHWCGGYFFDGQEMYSAIDVNVFAHMVSPSWDRNYHQLELQNNWSETSYNQVIRGLLKAGAAADAVRLQTLMDGGEAELEINETLGLKEIDRKTALGFWHMLLFRGYLTAVKRLNPGEPVPRYSVRIPNKEIRDTFCQNLRWLFTRGPDFEAIHDSIVKHAFKGEARELNAALNAYLSTYVSEEKFASEKYYPGLIDGILSDTSGLVSDRESKTDCRSHRHDFMFSARRDYRTGVIIGMKAVSDMSELESAADEGLKALPETSWVKDNRIGAEVIHAYSVAFCQRTCLVRYRKIDGLR